MKTLTLCLDAGNWASELNWTGNSNSRMERNWPPIAILSFGCVWYLMLESKGSLQFQFLFGCINHGIEFFLSLDNINFARVYINNMYISECLYIIFDT